MSCFCGRPAGPDGRCPYHSDNCVKDPICRKKLVFTAHCEECHLPGGEITGESPLLKKAKIHGPLFIETVAGDIHLEGARGRDLYIYNVRGNIHLSNGRFSHVYIDVVLGHVDMAGGKAGGLILARTQGVINMSRLRAGGHIYVGESSGLLDLSGATAAGEIAVEKFRGDVKAGAKAHGISLQGVRGSIILAGAAVDGDISILDSQGERLDLSGVEIGGRIFLINSKFGGVRIDNPAVLKKVVYLA